MAVATDGCNVIGRHNFLAQKLEATILSLVSVHSHAHRFCLLLYCRRFGQFGVRNCESILKANCEKFDSGLGELGKLDGLADSCVSSGMAFWKGTERLAN